MNAASALRAAVLASMVRPGQWVGPAGMALSAVALALWCVPHPVAWATLSGWLGWIAFALSLVLTVRARALAARFGGLDHQYAWHHVLGLLAYLALLLHALAVAGPFLAAREFGMAARSWSTGAIAGSGWFALGLLILPLAVTFHGPPNFRRWLRWHRIAGLAFAAAALHVARVIGIENPAWWTIALIGASALAARSWVYRREAGRRYIVSRVVHPANACVEVELEPLDRALVVAPGQYVFVAFHSGEQYHSCNEYHPFTVSGVHGQRITLTIKALGDCTLEMQHLSVGLAAHIEGPFGAFFDQATADTPQLWIAGGIGITPFLAQLDRLGTEVDIKMAYLFRRGEDALHMDELAHAADMRAGMELFTLVSSTDLTALWAWLDGFDPSTREIYVCGPPPLLDAVVQRLKDRGVGDAHLHFERFDFR